MTEPPLEDILPPFPDKPAAEAEPDLAALIGSRICHDLTNPLGAIGNGMELLELSGQAASPEMALIGQAVANARARVQFLRVAFGAAGAGHRMGGAELATLVADHAKGGRVAIHWPGGTDMPRPDARLGFLLLMCLEAALPFGGQITVTRPGESWHMVAAAPRIRDLGPLWAGLTGTTPLPEIGPAQVQFALAPRAAARLGRTLTLTPGEGVLTLTA